MQFPLRASAGFEHRVKSERICGTALFPGRPHNSGLDTMTCSLMAKSAQAPAQSGVALALLSPHASLELCTIALHRTVVV